MWHHSRLQSRCASLALGRFALFQNGWLAHSQFVDISFNNLCSMKRCQSTLWAASTLRTLSASQPACHLLAELWTVGGQQANIEPKNGSLSRWNRWRRLDSGSLRFGPVFSLSGEEGGRVCVLPACFHFIANKIKHWDLVAAVTRQISQSMLMILSSSSSSSPSPLFFKSQYIFGPSGGAWPGRNKKIIYLVFISNDRSHGRKCLCTRAELPSLNHVCRWFVSFFFAVFFSSRHLPAARVRRCVFMTAAETTHIPELRFLPRGQATSRPAVVACQTRLIVAAY